MTTGSYGLTTMTRTKSTEARAKMLDAAVEVLLDLGVAACSIDEVARRSGVAKTTIYRHFSNRSELIVAAMDGRVPIPNVPDTGAFRADLIGFYREIMPIFADPAVRRLQLDIFAAALRDPELARFDREQTRTRSTSLLTIYQRGQQRGEIDPNISFLDAFDYLEGPLVVRSLLHPEALADLDLEAMADRAIKLLRPSE